MYCGNLEKSLKLLARLRKESPKLQKFLQTQQQTNPQCRSLDLSSFVLVPMQRITRYPLLWKAVVSATPDSHPDHNTARLAQGVSENIAKIVNDCM